MHIIGIDIKDGESKVLKNLRKDWYPFGNYNKPVEANNYKWREDAYSDHLYQTNPSFPPINISCVVGKNGSGKTTLLHIFYLILNNLSYCLLKSHETIYDTAYNEYAYGIEADMYYEIDGIPCYVSVKKSTPNAECYAFNSELHKYDDVKWPNSTTEIESFLSHFFYTIGVNYSLYSMQFKEDVHNFDNEVTDNWLRFIYKNEEAYYMPITICPDRVGGQIDIKSERKNLNEQLITLFTLLKKQNKTIYNYQPTRISYQIDEDFTKDKKNDLDWLFVHRNLSGVGADLMVERFKEKWSSILEELIDQDSPYKDIKDLLLFYLAYHSVRLCLTYKSFGDVFNLADIQRLDDKGEYSSPVKLVDAGNYMGVVNKIRKGKDELTAFYTQFLQFINNKHLHPEKGEIIIDSLICYLGDKLSYNSVYCELPPSFYSCTLYIKNSQEEKDYPEITTEQLSSGEKQILLSNTAVLSHIYRIAHAEEDIRVVPYKDINIVIDEVELYAHPDYQRTYISQFIDLLNDLQISKEKIQSINMLIATHSPFLLSDVPNENVLRLDNGSVVAQTSDTRTFCSNIYDLMADSFFMKHPMGECARRHIDNIIHAYNTKGEESQNEMRSNKEFYNYLTSIIGDSYLRETVSAIVDSIIVEDKTDIHQLMLRREKIEYELKQIDEQISLLNEETEV